MIKINQTVIASVRSLALDENSTKAAKSYSKLPFLVSRDGSGYRRKKGVPAGIQAGMRKYFYQIEHS